MPATLELLRVSASTPPAPGVRSHSSRHQADRHLDLHRLQGLRGGVPGVERPAAGNHGAVGHLPDAARHVGELLEPDQVPRARGERRAAVADAQGPVHALRRPGLSRRLPRARRHRPVHQRHRRFSAGPVHRVRLLHHRLPVRRAEDSHEDEARLQVHAVRGPCRRRPAARLREGVSDQLPAVRDEGRDARHRHQAGRAAAGERVPERGRLRSARRRRHVGGDRARPRRPPRAIRLAARSVGATRGEALEGAAQVDREPGDARGSARSVRSLRTVRAERLGGTERTEATDLKNGATKPTEKTENT